MQYLWVWTLLCWSFNFLHLKLVMYRCSDVESFHLNLVMECGDTGDWSVIILRWRYSRTEWSVVTSLPHAGFTRSSGSRIASFGTKCTFLYSFFCRLWVVALISLFRDIQDDLTLIKARRKTSVRTVDIADQIPTEFSTTQQGKILPKLKIII